MIRAKASDAVATGTAASVTLPVLQGQSYKLEQVIWSYTGDGPLAGNLLIYNELETTLLSVNITNAGPGFLPLAGVSCRGVSIALQGVTGSGGTLSLLYSLTGDLQG